MRSTWRASQDLSNAVDGYARAMTALMSMPARLACDFSSAFEAAACRPKSSNCCDPCPPKCETSCEDSCDPCASDCSSSCAPSCDPCQVSVCSCGGRGCSKCGHRHRRLEKDAWVELRGGRIGVVDRIDDCYVFIKFPEAQGAPAQQYSRSAIAKVVGRPLAKDARVMTTLGIVGKITHYDSKSSIVKIELLGKEVEIDRCAIVEVLP